MSVSIPALINNRIVVRKSRHGATQHRYLGAYYAVDQRTDDVGRKGIDLETLARELRVLKAWEELAE